MQTARRELFEETGLTGEGELIGRFEGAIFDLGLAEDSHRVGHQLPDDTLVVRHLDGDRATPLPPQRDKLRRARFSPSGRLTATSSDEGVVRLWETDTGRPVWRAPVLLEWPFELFNPS